MRDKLNSEDIEKIPDLYATGMSLYALGKLLNVKYTTIKYHLLKQKITLRKGNQNKKYKCNDNYFIEIDSHEKAYWIGFIAADGSVNSQKNLLSIGLAIKDLEHLKLFRKDLESDSKIFTYDSLIKGKKHKCCKLTIYSKQIVNDLKSHNIVPNKSDILEFSQNIPKQYVSSYLLGIIDGDGCFSLGKDKQVRLNLISSYNIVHSIQEILKVHCQISGTIHEEKRSKGMFYFSCGGNKQMTKLYKYLYQSPRFLERKKRILGMALCPTNY